MFLMLFVFCEVLYKCAPDANVNMVMYFCVGNLTALRRHMTESSEEANSSKEMVHSNPEIFQKLDR